MASKSEKNQPAEQPATRTQTMRVKSVAPMSQVPQYNEDVESFSNYRDRLEAYFNLFNTAEGEKVNTFIVVIGPELYSILKNKVSPDLPTSKTYTELVEILEEHFSPRKLVPAERLKFYRRQQVPGESITDYILTLKKLSSTCEFGQFLDEALRDKLISGVQSEDLVKKLLAEPTTLTFKGACEICLNFETVNAQSKYMTQTPTCEVFRVSATRNTSQRHGGDRPSVTSTHQSGNRNGTRPSKRVTQQQQSTVSNSKSSVCQRCGRTSHSSEACPAVTNRWVCFSCNKKGHTSKMCRSKSVNSVSSEQCKSVNSVSSSEQCNNVVTSQAINSISSSSVIGLSINEVIVNFEVDTGSSISIMPIKLFNKLFSKLKLNKSSIKPKSVSGEPIRVCGETSVKVKYNNFEYVCLLVVCEGIDKPLLGRTWLDILNPSWRGTLLENGSQVVKGIVAEQSVLGHDKQMIEVIRHSFPNILPESNNSPVKEFVVNIPLKANSVPVFHKAYTVPYSLRVPIEKELKRLEQGGIIKRVRTSDYASPMVAVPKKDGNVRLCVNLKRTINPSVMIDHYPLPLVEDVLNEFVECKYYCVLDLSNAYLQLKVAEESQPLLTVNTHLGLFQFTRLCFGLNSAPSIFQSVIDRVLLNLKRVKAYIDDVIIGGISLEECKSNLKSVLSRLNKYNLKLNVDKCVFFKEKVEILGYLLEDGKIKPSPSKIEAIRCAPTPGNITQLRAYLGLINFYHRFLHMPADLLHPLYELTKKDVQWKWTNECELAFQKSKTLLSEETQLILYNAKLPIVLTCDSSSYGVGAVISHIVDGIEKPIAFASSALSEVEKKYCQLEKEAFAIIFGIKKFHKMLWGVKFTLVTDHQPLQFLFSPHKDIPIHSANRIVRWSLFMSAYNYEIKFKQGKCIGNADGLSRLPMEKCIQLNSVENDEPELIVPSEFSPLTVIDVANESKSDRVLQSVMYHLMEGWPHKPGNNILDFYKRREVLSIKDGCLMIGLRVVIPKSLQSRVLEILHKNHFGIVRTKMIARSFVWWQSIENDIERIVKSCANCQLFQNKGNTYGFVSWPKAETPWHRLHMDFLDFKKRKILLLVDECSKWPEAWLMNSTSAVAVTEKLSECFSKFGPPFMLVADNGPPFQSVEVKKFCAMSGIQYVNTPPYTPTANGLAERTVQSLKRHLIKQLANKFGTGSLQSILIKTLFAIRTTPSTVTNLTPAEVLLKVNVRTPISILNPKFTSKLQYPVLSKNVPIFHVNQKVLVCATQCDNSKWIPGRVAVKISRAVYIVRCVDGSVRKISISNIKPSVLDDQHHPSPIADLVVTSEPAPADDDSSMPLALRRGRRIIQRPKRYQD